METINKTPGKSNQLSKKIPNYKEIMLLGVIVLIVLTLIFFAIHYGWFTAIAHAWPYELAGIVAIIFFFLFKKLFKKNTKKRWLKLALATLVFLGIGFAAYKYMPWTDSFKSKNSAKTTARKKIIADSIAIVKLTNAKLDSIAKIDAKNKAMLAVIAAMRADSANTAKLNNNFAAADENLCEKKDTSNAILAEYEQLKKTRNAAMNMQSTCNNVLHASLSGVGKVYAEEGGSSIAIETTEK